MRGSRRPRPLSRRLVVSTAVLLTLAACTPRAADPPPEPAGTADEATGPTLTRASLPGCAGIETLRAPWESAEGVREAHVYVDLSASMQGYARDRRSTLYQAASLLKEVLVRQGVERFRGAGYGVDVAPLETLPGLTDALAWPANEASTCLAAPLTEEIRSGEAAITVLLTDGVASNVGGACGQTCGEGSDVSCVGKAIVDYVREGFGLWVVGLRIPYSGRYFPEISGGAIRVPSGETRPIYFWVFSADLALGRVVAQEVASGSGSGALAFEAWPGEWRGLIPERGENASSADLAAPAFADARQLRGLLPVSRIGQVEDVPLVALETSTSGDGAVWAGRLALADPGATVEPRWVGESLVDVYGSFEEPAEEDDSGDGAASARCFETPAKDLPDLDQSLALLAPEPTTGRGRILTGCVDASEAPAPGSWTRPVDLYLATSVDRLPLALTATFSAETGDLAFLDAWSTRDDSTVAEIDKTLGLSSLWRLVAGMLVNDRGWSCPVPLLWLEDSRSSGE